MSLSTRSKAAGTRLRMAGASLILVTILTGVPVQATAGPPEYSSSVAACLALNDIACARINAAYHSLDEGYFANLLTLRATGSTRVLPGWLDLRITITCVERCDIAWVGDHALVWGPYTRRVSCAFPGGTAVSCGVAFDLSLTQILCDTVLEVDTAAATRFGSPLVATPVVAYARRTEKLSPCPWHRV